jgi:hypothetical protein
MPVSLTLFFGQIWQLAQGTGTKVKLPDKKEVIR